jgi:hypothetical protein
LKAGILLKRKVFRVWYVVCGRWGKNRIQDSGGRTAGDRVQRTGKGATADSLLLTADCLLTAAFEGEFDLAGLSARTAAYDKVSLWPGEKKPE